MSSGGRMFISTQTTNRFLKYLCKLSKCGEGTVAGQVPKRFTAAGWISSSFTHRISPYGAVLAASTAKSKFPVIFQNSKTSYLQLQSRRGARGGGGRSFRGEQQQYIDKTRTIPNKFTNMDRVNYIFKPFAFTALVGTSSIVGCTIWQYEEYRKSVISGRFSLSALRDNVFGEGSSSTGQRRSDSVSDLVQRAEAWWNNLSPGEKIFWPICALNSIVWLAWRIPSWAPTMVTYFSATPVGRRICLPMLLSTFSHYSFLHLCANMFVLHSFIPAAAQILGKEQFVAMYLTSGTIASLGSHLHKLFVGNCTPSLGASGAIMGILGLVCTRMPDIQLGIIFLPGIQFTADTALKCILAIDSAGVLLGWKFMDHAAHLSGCLFGIAFSHWGGQTFWSFRDFVMTHWHKYRTSTSS